MARFKPLRKNQFMLLPPSVEDFIPEDHLARVVSEIVDGLDTERIEDKYSELGQNSYHPKILLKILFYGYATGVRSGRKISSKCETDTAFMYLTQMYHPDFRTVNDFRKNNIEEIGRYFVDVVRMCDELGMVKVGSISIDGSKIRANASPKLTKEKAEYERWQARIEDEIKRILNEAEEVDALEDEVYGDRRGDELPEEIRTKEDLKRRIKDILKDFEKTPKKKINLTDYDCSFMQERKGVISASYNCQLSVTNDQVIVAADVTDKANDRHELVPMVEQTEDNTGKDVEKVIADSGYASYDNYEYLARRGKEAFIPDQYFERVKKKEGEGSENKYHKENFTFDKERNRYICPERKTLEFFKKRVSDKGKMKRRQAIYKGAECEKCQAKHLCTTQKERTVARELREEHLEKVRERLLSEEGRKVYRKRLYTVEPLFGHLKYNLGYRTFLLRTFQKVRAEFKLMCIGYNLKKIWSLGMLETVS